MPMEWTACVDGAGGGVAWMQDDGQTSTYVPYVLTLTHSIDHSRQNGHWPPWHCLPNPTQLYNEDDESPITMFAGVF